MAVTKDPTHPDFPHGEAKGWYRGCRSDLQCPASPSCRQVRLRAQKATRVGIAPPRWVPADPVRAHVRRLLAEHPELTIAAVARAAGIRPMKLAEVMRNGRPGTARRISAAVQSVTASEVFKHTSRVDAAPARHIINTLRALGYSMRWQGTRCGMQREYLEDIASARWLTVSRGDDERLRRLAAEVGDRAADPARDGLRPAAITKTKRQARREGWYPPACYDDSGELIPEAIPDHPWTQANDQAWLRIEVIRDTIAGFSSETIARRHRVDPRTIIRHRRLAGLRLTPTEDNDGYVLADPGVGERWSELIRQVDRGDVHPVTLMLDTGLLSIRMVPGDHPAAVEWSDRARQPQALAA